MTLKQVRGKTIEENIKSIDGLLYSLVNKGVPKPADEKLFGRIRRLENKLDAIAEYLGIDFAASSGMIVIKTKKVAKEIENVIDQGSSGTIT